VPRSHSLTQRNIQSEAATSILQPKAVYDNSQLTLFPRTPLFSSSLAMASQRLALSLKQGLRTRAALRSIQPSITRSFATPVSHGSKTECTTLSNGFTVSYNLLGLFNTYSPSRRLPPSTRLGHRLPLSAYGSMPVAGQKPTRPMEQHTFSNILPSR